MAFSNYLSKMRGGGESPPRVGPKEIVWSVLGSFTGIGGCCYLSAAYFEPRDLTLIIASFGASAVLIYGAVKSPLAQPRNLVGGHLISAIIGVACYHSFGGLWFSAALAVSCAIAVMLFTGTLHPPGGATALLAVTGSAQIHKLGFLYLLVPVGLGVFVMLAVALTINNLSGGRKYPEYWL
ncbi:MAG: HPP family protein [Syntrophorhabdales bacterium]|jgi:CBS-domain-containing membrane protein